MQCVVFLFILITAVVVSNGHNVLMGNGMRGQGSYEEHVLTRKKQSNDWITKVHMVFMNHLDVGYASFINNVLNEYFQTYFLRAATISQTLRQNGYVERLVYTTHPWLLSLYLDCPPNLVLAGVKLQCPTQAQKDVVVGAILKGDITWHAGPMNLEIEMAEPWLFEFSIDLSIQLDKKFNITRTGRALSQRDVPGITQTCIPSLVKKGVLAVSVGVNDMTPPPAVPKLFLWQYGTDSVMGTWHPGGYPDNAGSIPVNPGGLSRNDCAFVEGLNDALCFVFRTDNSGPPESVQEVLNAYEILRAEFPNAELNAGGLEEFFVAANSIRDRLPILTNEIGDTWIQGVASDPRKCAEYRAMSRVMRDCVASESCLLTDVRVWNSSRFLVKLPEHTWGLPSEYDTSHWANPDFYPLRKTNPNFINSANSWSEQRNFTYLALEALQDHPVVDKILKEMLNIVPKVPDLSNYARLPNPSQVFQCPSANIKALQFGLDGSIIKLLYNNIDWSDADHRLASFVYSSFDQADFDNFGRVYNYNGHSAGYYKPNVTASAHPESRVWPAVVSALYSSKVDECDFYASIQMTDQKSVTWYGAPAQIWVHYLARDASKKPGLDITFQWFNKTITRLPEGLSLTFKPIQQKGFKWTMYKMGLPVDPYNVLLNGSQYNHVLSDDGLTYTGVKYDSVGLQIRSPDIPIVNVLVQNELSHVFPAPLAPVPSGQITGFAFNAYNNIWETNYIMWYPYLDNDANFKARFGIDFVSSAWHGRREFA